jgi:hypothetical protein
MTSIVTQLFAHLVLVAAVFVLVAKRTLSVRAA